uniref:Kinesin motor domain-containing protein n=1 Tax=Macrostomum lignano TaxID=282301 RepID=A0A1I8IUN5_9PLAT
PFCEALGAVAAQEDAAAVRRAGGKQQRQVAHAEQLLGRPDQPQSGPELRPAAALARGQSARSSGHMVIQWVMSRLVFSFRKELGHSRSYWASARPRPQLPRCRWRAPAGHSAASRRRCPRQREPSASALKRAPPSRLLASDGAAAAAGWPAVARAGSGAGAGMGAERRADRGVVRGSDRGAEFGPKAETSGHRTTAAVANLQSRSAPKLDADAWRLQGTNEGRAFSWSDTSGSPSHSGAGRQFAAGPRQIAGQSGGASATGIHRQVSQQQKETPRGEAQARKIQRRPPTPIQDVISHRYQTDWIRDQVRRSEAKSAAEGSQDQLK